VQSGMTGEVGGPWGAFKAAPLAAMPGLQINEILRSRHAGIYLVRVNGEQGVLRELLSLQIMEKAKSYNAK
ncbi:MAG: hypothetical protein AAF223_13165, partial [Bacteroidota bacterium]